MQDYVDGLLKKIFEQAKSGLIKIGNKEKGEWQFFVNFLINNEGILNKKENDNCLPVINISNYESFIKKISDYLVIARNFYKQDKVYYDLDDVAFDEKLIIDLFINATYVQMSNILNFIDFRVDLLKNELKEEEFFIGRFAEYKAFGKIEKNRSNLEAPYKFKIYFENGEGDKFLLPSITFGVIDDKIYIYAVQSKKEKQTSKCAKTLDRYFRKLNKGIEEESLEHQVSPNALASFVIFSSYARKSGFNYICAYDILPIRYFSGIKLDEEKNKFFTEKELYEKHDQDQFNMTNKLMYLFLRYGFHFGEKSVSYDENQGEIGLNLTNLKLKGDNIIYDLDCFVDVSKSLIQME